MSFCAPFAYADVPQSDTDWDSDHAATFRSSSSFKVAFNSIIDLVPIKIRFLADSISKGVKRCIKRVLPPPSTDEIVLRPIISGGTSRLETLPQELILEILSYLPLASKACLTTCSRTMARRLGTQYWSLVRKNRNGPISEFASYLRLLQRDKQDSYCCYECLRLHSIEGRDHVGPRDQSFDWHWRGVSALNQDYIRTEIGISPYLALHHIQLAMARYRYYGLPDGRIEALSYSNNKPYRTGVKYFDMEARYASGRLLIRTQYMLETDMSLPEAELADYEESLGLTVLGCFCVHGMEGSFRRRKPDQERFFRCARDHGNTQEAACPNCKFWPYCSLCPTEAATHKATIEPNFRITVITLWKDYENPVTPLNKVWRAHVAYRSSDRYHSGFKDWNWKRNQIWGLNNIRQRFEELPGMTVQKLTDTNLRKLERRKRPLLHSCLG